MAALSFSDARAIVLREVGAAVSPVAESVALGACANRVLAEDVTADRDYPPFPRSMRDGFAVRSADLPGDFRVIGEVRAGHAFAGIVGKREAVEIMTGAPAPAGADAVVMVEHCTRHPDGTVSTERTLSAGDNIAPQGCEAVRDSILLARGTRLDYAGVACLAAVGRSTVPVFARPRVAILSTGDEVVDVSETPTGSRIRNSNAWSLATQVERAGGVAEILPIARDNAEHTRGLIDRGLDADLLLVSGGVSAGKFDVVEPVLAKLGATFFFDRVLIQPGQPLVFGQARGKFFFGLPGNPASTMVTFELFARAAIGLLAGAQDTGLPFGLAQLASAFHHKPGLTRFLPAYVRGTDLTPVAWKGSGDIASLCRANAYLVAEPDRTQYAAGDLISFLYK